MTSPYVMPNVAYTPKDVRENWEAKIVLRVGDRSPVLKTIKQVDEQKLPATRSYGSLVWRVWVFRGDEAIIDWYVDKLNLVFIDEGKPYVAPPALIDLLDTCKTRLKFETGEPTRPGR